MDLRKIRYILDGLLGVVVCYHQVLLDCVELWVDRGIAIVVWLVNQEHLAIPAIESARNHPTIRCFKVPVTAGWNHCGRSRQVSISRLRSVVATVAAPVEPVEQQ